MSNTQALIKAKLLRSQLGMADKTMKSLRLTAQPLIDTYFAKDTWEVRVVWANFYLDTVIGYLDEVIEILNRPDEAA